MKVNISSYAFYLFVFILIFLSNSNFTFSQIKIGNNPKSINKDALIDLESNDKGFLLPRIELVSINSPLPLSNFTSGMVVYNTTNKNNISPGIYYSDGLKWIRASNNPISSNINTEIKNNFEIVLNNEQSIFTTPDIISDINKIFLYRNGILILFTVKDNRSIVSELPCKKGDYIRIIQLL